MEITILVTALTALTGAAGNEASSLPLREGQGYSGGYSEEMGIVEKLSSDLYRVEVSSLLYEREAVFTAAHRLNELFYVKVEPRGEDSFAVLLQCREAPQNSLDAEKAAHELVNDILEEQVRLDLVKRTGALREIIYQHAFIPLEEQKAAHE